MNDRPRRKGRWPTLTDPRDRPDKDEATGSNPVGPTRQKPSTRRGWGFWRLWGGEAGPLSVGARREDPQPVVAGVVKGRGRGERGLSVSCCPAAVLSSSSGGVLCLRLVPSGSGVRPAGSGRGCADEALPGAAAVPLRCRAAAVRVVRVVRWSVVLVLVLAAERRCRLGPMNRAAGRSLRWCLPVVPVGHPHRLFLRWSFCCGGSAAVLKGRPSCRRRFRHRWCHCWWSFVFTYCVVTTASGVR